MRQVGSFPASLASPLDGATLLLVEDVEAVRGVVVCLLERLGLHVLTASGGEEALALHAAHSGCIDLVLLDCQMPGMDGVEVLRVLAQRAPTPRVVLTSGQEGLAEVDEELLSGRAAGFLAKPFRVDELRATLERALAEPQA